MNTKYHLRARRVGDIRLIIMSISSARTALEVIATIQKRGVNGGVSFQPRGARVMNLTEMDAIVSYMKDFESVFSEIEEGFTPNNKKQIIKFDEE